MRLFFTIISMKRISLLCVAIFGLCAIGRAQPATAPDVVASAVTPQIDVQAQTFIEQMIDRYAALKSYSDVTQMRMEDTTEAPTKAGGMKPMDFQATLQWERPANIRFEGRDSSGAFLALGTPDILRIVSAHYPNNYVARQRSQTVTLTGGDGKKVEVPAQPLQLNEPMAGDPIPGGPAMGFIFQPEYWSLMKKDARSLQFDPDAQTDGEDCRVVRADFLSDEGHSSEMRLFVAKRDGLLRRMEMRFDQLPANNIIAETHSDVKVNPDLPASTWEFEAPANAQPIDYFSRLDEHKFDPDLKIGAMLPIFSAEAVDGSPLELNPKSGKVTVVYFFRMSMGTHDVQVLNKIARLVGPDKLQVVGVSGDGLRPRVEEFANHYKLNFPIYFNESAMGNQLVLKFGVQKWSSSFIFDKDGTLKFVDSSPSYTDFQEHLRTLIPTLKGGDFIPQGDEVINAQ